MKKCLGSDPILGGDHLLHGRLLLQPTVEIFLRLHFEVRLHVVVSQTTKLGTDYFVLANLGGSEMNRQIYSGYEILGMHEQMHFPVHWDSHLSGYDIVLGVWIVGGIKTKEILVSLTDQFRVEGAELTIRAGIAKIESKLAGLHLNWHGVRRRWSEIDAGPGLGSEYAQGQNFGSYQQE